MGRWSRVQVVDTDYLVIGTRGQVFAITGEAHRVDGARVMAHGGELPGFVVVRVARAGNGLGRPNADMAI